MCTRGPTTFTAGFAMPLSKIVSRWILSSKDHFRFICMWWGPLYDHEDRDIENSSGSSKRVEPRKRKVRQGLQTYDGSLCKVLPAQSLCLNQFLWAMLDAINLATSSDFFPHTYLYMYDDTLEKKLFIRGRYVAYTTGHTFWYCHCRQRINSASTKLPGRQFAFWRFGKLLIMIWH